MESGSDKKMEESENSDISSSTSEISHSNSFEKENANFSKLYELISPEKRSFWVCVLILRLCLPIFTKHFMHADEYWQGTEIAYHLVYGGVALPWEWKVQHPIRSTLFPAIYAVFYYIAKQIGVDSNLIVTNLPYVLQSIFVFIADICFYKFTRKHLGREIAYYSILFYISNPMILEAMPKVLSNSMETILLLIGLFVYSSSNSRNLYSKIIPIICMVSFIIRNTSAISWVFIIIGEMIQNKTFSYVFANYAYITIPVFSLTVLLDYQFYNAIHLIPYNFLKFNVLDGMSDLFGTSGKYDYFLQFLPDQLSNLYIFAIIGIIIYTIKKLLKKQFPILFFIPLAILGVHTKISHKEYRFILPAIPLLIILATEGFIFLLRKFVFLKKLIFWFIIFTNMFVLIIHLGGRTHNAKIFDHIFKNIDVNRETTIGIYNSCYISPYYTQSHGMNVTVISNDCTPLELLDKDQHKYYMHPYSEFYHDHMINFTFKTYEERIHYFVTNSGITQPQRQFFSKEIMKFYKLDAVITIGRNFEYPINFFDLQKLWADLQKTQKMYVYKIKSEYSLSKI